MINIKLVQDFAQHKDQFSTLIHFNQEDIAPLDACALPEKIVEQFSLHKYSGKKGQVLFLPCLIPNMNHIFIGLGKLDGSLIENTDDMRDALTLLINTLKKYEIEEALAHVMPNPELLHLKSGIFAQDCVTTVCMADYQFTQFKKKQDAKPEKTLNITLAVLGSYDPEKILSQGLAIGQAVNFTRGLSNLPPNIATPLYVSQKTKEWAEKYNLECTILDKQTIKEMGMGGVTAVGAASVNEPKFVVVKRAATQRNSSTKTIALVGKGVCFDSGGISLKPSNSMCGMKYDMSGAAAVLGVIFGLAQQDCPHDVIAIAPLVENLIDGNGYRQDDIITHYNGLTSEILNTDAEGRLILADALVYAEKDCQADVIVDIATLTGACVVALGHFYTGLMTRDEQLVEKLSQAGQRSGDYVWRLPLNNRYAKAIESRVADMANCGKPGFGAGATTAACYLEKFVEKAQWAHLDIAGTEFDQPLDSYLGKLATGVGVRLLVEFVLKF